jgi:selenocysteine lyase/cysteine desulfurase
MNANTENALLILDHTTSNTAINMPLKSLSQFSKEQKMLVMVDGAHGLLAQDVSLDALPNVDFYLANGHKWLACPRGVGLLYCPHSDMRDTILEQPAVISHGIGHGFQSRFLWDGCRDYAAALAVPAVLDYWQEKDVTLVQQQIRTNLHEAVTLLGDAWHNNSEGSVTLAPLSLHSPMMALVRLPASLQKALATSDDAKRIQDYLYDQFIEVPIKCILGVLYVRISCHVYNSLTEYDRLAQVILQYKGS